MRVDRADFREESRAQSEILGTVLIVSMVIAGALIVIGAGSLALNSVNDQVNEENAESVLQEVDSRLASVATEGESPLVEMDFGSTRAEKISLDRDGYFNLTINENPACSINHTLSSLRYTSNQAEYIYQTGGVWRLSRNSSVAITSPDFDYFGGRIDLSLYNITGGIDKTQVEFRRNVSVSQGQTASALATLSQGECVRPDSVQIEIQSAAYQGWAEHIEREIGENVTVFHSNNTIQASLPQNKLAQKTDDSRNSVVNLSGPSYMSDVTLDAASGTISVDKGVGNNYSVFAEPLTEDRPDIGQIRFISDTTNTTRRPIDVVLVLDESGSMSGSKMDGAREAAKDFVGGLNHSQDRVGIVSYNSNSNYHRVHDQYLTRDFDAANNSIDNIYAGGGTRISKGMYRSNLIHSFKTNESRDKITIVLTDGVNDIGWGADECDSDDDPDPTYDCYLNTETIEEARDAKQDGVTMYTIGLGGESYIAQPLLKDIANTTGGNYYNADDAGELGDVFESIRQDVNEQRFVSKIPLSTNITSASGGEVTPQIPGVAGVDMAEYHDFVNVNDPTAPSKFSHSFGVSGGEAVHLNLSTYHCDTYEEMQKTYTNDSNTYSVARCADINETKGIKNNYSPSRILTNGDDASPLINPTPGFWENDIHDALSQYPDVDINGTTGKLSMNSNQAIVVFDLPDSRNADNKLAVLYQIGNAESEVAAEGVINVDIARLIAD